MLTRLTETSVFHFINLFNSHYNPMRHYNYFINIYFTLYCWNWSESLKIENEKVVEHVFESRESGSRVQTYKHHAMTCPKWINWQVTKWLATSQLISPCLPILPFAEIVLMSTYKILGTKNILLFNLTLQVCLVTCLKSYN